MRKKKRKKERKERGRAARDERKKRGEEKKRGVCARGMSQKKRGEAKKNKRGNPKFLKGQLAWTVDANSRLSASTLEVDADNPIYLFFYFLIRV
jgi:hypothetical protein